MLDIHTHILPEIDDGSSSVEQSIEMISMLVEQGVDKIVFTPHFYAEMEAPEQFLERRHEAYQKLLPYLKEQFPDSRFRLGTEICYYIGVSVMEDKKRLCIEGTPLFLLELPMCKWERSVITEVKELVRSEQVIVTLAHIDRYFDFNPLSVFEELARMGVLMQLNADFALEKRHRRFIKKLAKKGLLHFIGTDAHNTGARCPRYEDAMRNLWPLRDYVFGNLSVYEEQFFN